MMNNLDAINSCWGSTYPSGYNNLTDKKKKKATSANERLPRHRGQSLINVGVP